MQGYVLNFERENPKKPKKKFSIGKREGSCNLKSKEAWSLCLDFVFQRYKPGLSNFCPPKTFARFARRQAKSRVTVDLPRILLFT